MSKNLKATKRTPPGKTKNGKLKLRPLSITQLQEMIKSGSRPRDIDKWQRALNNKLKAARV